MRTKTRNARAAGDRWAQLKQMLEARRREIWDDVRRGMRIIRTERAPAKGMGVLDDAETSEWDFQDQIDATLLQMKSETLVQIDRALGQIGTGSYGWCVDCGGPISARRLQVLPFAVRCTACQECREAGPDGSPHRALATDDIDWDSGVHS